MGALTSLHVGENKIPKEEMREIMAIAMHMGSMKILCEVPFKDKSLTELDVSGKNLGREGALVVAEYLDDNGALSVLSLKKNNLCSKEAGEALAQALAGNSTLRELDVSYNQSPAGDKSARDGPGFAEELAVGIRDNGAVSVTSVTRDSLLAFYQEHCPQAADYVDFILLDRTVSELLGGCAQRY
jgi:hypothetical protein